jgi:hypothetical protein
LKKQSKLNQPPFWKSFLKKQIESFENTTFSSKLFLFAWLCLITIGIIIPPIWWTDGTDRRSNGTGDQNWTFGHLNGRPEGPPSGQVQNWTEGYGTWPHDRRSDVTPLGSALRAVRNGVLVPGSS